MSTQQTETAARASTATSALPDQRGRAEAETTVSPSPLKTEQGSTAIASVVVQKIAGVAAREVIGVYDLGTGGARRVATVRSRIPGSTGTSYSQGVAVEVGEREAAVDLDVVLDYGVSMPQVADAIRSNVIRSIERGTGLKVVEVNVSIDDIHVEDSSTDTDRPSRVQ